MSGWKKAEEGSVKITHYSTSSTIEVVVTDKEEYQPGHFREETNSLWLDYYQFEDLKKAIEATGDSPDQSYNQAIQDVLDIVKKYDTGKELSPLFNQMIPKVKSLIKHS